ncbi:Zinc finger, CCHC-type [Plasmopara halstedii]|uniref:Zinc finger, CCHC-type n=1 Tax=Plasmopara halstedii TaxID=4781 RepID=A0A0N7L6V2_PLAHL|nr:Zinc finger, CCHC-type [Plasmopara halstedii]CEG45307.1 Zinc finger, CCHC-type [Plasmopara halstedii]|eukprot:XP_024581676.1 Zinc finger, CCHC-type [Plasmopara halstedii]
MLDNIIHYSSCELLTVLMAKYEARRLDFLVQAEELAHFAQSVKSDPRGPASSGKDVIACIIERKPRVETRACFGCGNVGHILAACPQREEEENMMVPRVAGGDKKKAAVYYTLCAQDSGIQDKVCILDSASSLHLVNNAVLDAREYEDQCLVANPQTAGGDLNGTGPLKPCGSRVIFPNYYSKQNAANQRSASSNGARQAEHCSPNERLLRTNASLRHIVVRQARAKGYGLEYTNDRRANRSLSTGDVV